jgi:hypothetical protein
MSDDLSTAQRIVIGHAKAIARILTVSAGVGIAVVCARLLNLSDIEVLGLEAPLRHVWFFFVLVTIAHLFFGWILVKDLGRSRDEDDSAGGKRLFDALRTEESSLLRGILPRQTPVQEGSRVYKMSWSDPTTWLFCGLALLNFAAILPWKLNRGDFVWDGGTARVVTLVALGLVLLFINWMVGGQWLVMLSQLTLDEAPAFSFGGSVPVWYERYTMISVLAVVMGLVITPFLIVVLF